MSDDTVYRVREPHAVRHPQTSEFVVPSPSTEYAADDPLVLAHPWLFVAVEAASAAPGERRRPRVLPA